MYILNIFSNIKRRMFRFAVVISNIVLPPRPTTPVYIYICIFGLSVPAKGVVGTGGSREPPVPVEGVQAIRAIERYGKRYSGYRTLFKRYVGPMGSMGNPEDPWGPGSLSDPWDPFGPWGP